MIKSVSPRKPNFGTKFIKKMYHEMALLRDNFYAKETRRPNIHNPRIFILYLDRVTYEDIMIKRQKFSHRLSFRCRIQWRH